MHQVRIAGGILGQEHDGCLAGARLAARRPCRAVLKVDGDLQADDRLHPFFRQLFGKLQRAEEIVGIGNRQRRHRIGEGKLGELGDRYRPFAQGIGAVHMQMHEADIVEDAASIVGAVAVALSAVRVRDHCFRYTSLDLIHRSMSDWVIHSTAGIIGEMDSMLSRMHSTSFAGASAARVLDNIDPLAKLAAKR